MSWLNTPTPAPSEQTVWKSCKALAWRCTFLTTFAGIILFPVFFYIWGELPGRPRTNLSPREEFSPFVLATLAAVVFCTFQLFPFIARASRRPVRGSAELDARYREWRDEFRRSTLSRSITVYPAKSLEAKLDLLERQCCDNEQMVDFLIRRMIELEQRIEELQKSPYDL